MRSGSEDTKSVRQAKNVISKVREVLNYVPNDEVGAPLKWCVKRTADVFDWLGNGVQEFEENIIGITSEIETQEEIERDIEEGIEDAIIEDLKMETDEYIVEEILEMDE